MLTFHIEKVPLAWTPNIFLWKYHASISETGEIVNVMVKGARKTLYKGDNADIDNPLVQPPCVVHLSTSGCVWHRDLLEHPPSCSKNHPHGDVQKAGHPGVQLTAHN